jgi:Tol biopolymer transport system component
MVPNDWSLDGHLVFMDFAKGSPQLAMYSARDHSVAQFAGESEAQFSPDAMWIAYAGPRGRLSGEIFVQALRGPSRRLQISNAGGGQPRWSRDGRRIFYVAPDKKLMAVTFDPQSVTASAPQVLFQTRIVTFSHDFYQYDVAPDGRFLINSLPSSYSSPLTLVTGWTALLKEH